MAPVDPCGSRGSLSISGGQRPGVGVSFQVVRLMGNANKPALQACCEEMSCAPAGVTNQRGRVMCCGKAVSSETGGPQLCIYDVDVPAVICSQLEAELAIVAQPCCGPEVPTLEG